MPVTHKSLQCPMMIWSLEIYEWSHLDFSWDWSRKTDSIPFAFVHSVCMLKGTSVCTSLLEENSLKAFHTFVLVARLQLKLTTQFQHYDPQCADKKKLTKSSSFRGVTKHRRSGRCVIASFVKWFTMLAARTTSVSLHHAGQWPVIILHLYHVKLYIERSSHQEMVSIADCGEKSLKLNNLSCKLPVFFSV